MHDALRYRASAAKWSGEPGDSLLPCPACGLPITLVSVAPTSVANTDEITYWCRPCETEIKRQVRQRSLNGAH
jgi:hypothetical protein